MKCAVEHCDHIASKNHGFEQTAEIHGVRIKVSVLLCEECWRHITYGREEQPKQEYCAGCGIAFWKRITGEPVLTHMLNGKKYCTACFQRQKEPQKEKCAGCGKEFSKLFSHPYCIECFQRRQNQQKERQQANWSERTYSTEQQTCQNCREKVASWYTCAHCDTSNLCASCLSKHVGTVHLRQQQKDHTPEGLWEELFGSYTYSTRHEYGFSADQMAEDIARMRRYFSGDFNRQQSTAGGTAHTGTINGTFLPKEILDAFKALGIEPVKDIEAIKKAYKALALIFHPDTGGDHKSMVQLNKAKDTAIKWAGGR